MTTQTDNRTTINTLAAMIRSYKGPECTEFEIRFDTITAKVEYYPRTSVKYAVKIYDTEGKRLYELEGKV